jgi:hypothetical protein
MPSKASHPIRDMLGSESGSVIVSAIFGLGLAALFQRVCNGRQCMVVHGPEKEEIEKYYYKMDGECYKYDVQEVACPAASVKRG